jgi:hypothetical protein
MYRGTKSSLETALNNFIVTTGALTDELTSGGIGSGVGSIGATGDPLDERILGSQSAARDYGPYGQLQQVRGNALQAIGLLQSYASSLSPALRGEMYTVQGYAEVLLAELYCSGVPLSTLDFQGDFTYRPGSASHDVYAHAVTLFDSALAISSDSQSVIWFASVAKGRALLDLGDVVHADQAVAAVPDTFAYRLPVAWGIYGAGYGLDSQWTVADREGSNGVPFSSSSDPRVSVIAKGTNPFGVPLFAPAKYPKSSVVPVVLASGVEARLIQAEAALRAGDQNWLTILNALRTDGTEGLHPLTDPAANPLPPGKTAFDVRLDLILQERAYWLFLTGHRQGDLRRVVRATSAGGYGRAQNVVYPSGPYYGGLGSYGSDVNLPIPTAEQRNPLFHGCIDRGA